MTRWLVLSAVLLVLAAGVHAQTVTQSTQGWCSPAVADTEGNVTINCHGVDPRALARLNELLDKKDLELAQKIEEANQWAEKYNDLNARLAAAEDDSDLAHRARKLIEQGEFDQAGTILDELIEKQEAQVDHLAENHFNRAEVYSLQFDPINALPHYEKAHHYRPDHEAYAFSYAVALQKQNAFGRAAQVYAALLPRYRALAAANPAAYLPDLAGTLNNLGVLYSDTQRLADAETAFVEARDIRRELAAANPIVFLPKLANVSNNLRILYRDSGRADEADEVLAEFETIERQIERLLPH